MISPCEGAVNRRGSVGSRSCGDTSLTGSDSNKDQVQVPLQESATALFSQEEKWPICRHASFKDYLSEAPASKRCSGSSETVPTEPVGAHRGFTEGSALQEIELVGAFSERHQHQLYGGDVLCMAGKSKECPQGAVCFHGYWKCVLGKTLLKLTALQPAATKAPAVTERIVLCWWNERVAMSPKSGERPTCPPVDGKPSSIICFEHSPVIKERTRPLKSL